MRLHSNTCGDVLTTYKVSAAVLTFDAPVTIVRAVKCHFSRYVCYAGATKSWCAVLSPPPPTHFTSMRCKSYIM